MAGVGMPDDTLNQAILRGMSLMMQAFNEKEKIRNNKCVLKTQPQPLTWKRKNMVILNNWVASESLLGNHII